LTGARRRALRRMVAPLFGCSRPVGVTFAAEAQAATYTVGITTDVGGTCTSTSGKASLGQLVNDENNPTSIPDPPDTINVPAGIYVLTLVQLPATESVTIAGAGPRTTQIQTTSCSGGGLSNDGGTLTLTDSLVWNNSSTNPHGERNSGGIQNYGDDSVSAGTLTVDNSTIADNTSPLDGVISRWCNSASGEVSSTGATNTTTITDSTTFNNRGNPATNGGGLLASQRKISVQNSIVASNTVTNPLTGGQTSSNRGSSSPGVITSRGYSIETAADCGFMATGGLSNAGSAAGCEPTGVVTGAA
jgi:hypothetical protein